MSKISILFLSFTMLFSVSVYSQKKTDLEKIEFRGRAKKIQYFNTYLDEQTGWTNRQPWIAETYNSDGNILERIVFQDGEISSKVVSLYDEKGRNVGDDSFSASLDKTLSVPTRTEFVLD